MLADSDTRWKWGALTARRIAPGSRIDGLLLRGRATPTPRQLAEVGVDVDSLRETSGAAFVGEAADRGAYDVVVLACVGGAVQAMLHGMANAARTAQPQSSSQPEPAGVEAREEGHRRPVTVTGYVGVVYEKLADGLLLRHGADVVLANSRYDAERFRGVYEGAGADASSVTEGALPFLGGAPYEGRRDDRPFTVVFAAQPSVPAGREDRAYLLRRAAGHARSHPGREVLVKLRSRPGEHTTHIEEQPYQRLADRLPGGLPPNCRLVYGHMSEVLDRTDLLVTVSSTAALESLHRSIPTAVLTDLGVREALGNHHFLGSGCLASWDELDAGHLPSADAAWTARQGVLSGGPYERAFDEARERVARLAARDRLPAIAPYYTPTTAPGYLPGVLARYGFGPDGAVLPGAAKAAAAGASTGVRAAVRGAVRDAARGAYRHGVQRVAPVIRRMGEL
ncbi:hypothetical protein DB35_15450 [Streptomyces abyssalis]|uniref:Uncharacterized protein n=1 Tax=Streptomyces abyssalis TaxID=933944 RepID=A0A1E7JFW1_9ACTN|nr:DUF6716 putative glycosyltransferase [Streptomyces abyssalis]OEU85353.1 hypothetical protein AN215_22555 [Streptomyces abyssalis]OEU91476.1 hypothetical protein DB35_15450 [Streptomyces abyssalis]